MLKVKGAYYCRQFPTKLLLILEDGKHYTTNLTPFRNITLDELSPLPVYDATKPERYYDKYDSVPAYIMPNYGLQAI